MNDISTKSDQTPILNEIILILFQSLCIINMNDILMKSDQKLGRP